MKKLIYLFLTVLIVGCSSEDSNNQDNNDGDNNNNSNCEYVLNTLPVTNTTNDSATFNGIISIDNNCEFPITEQGFVYATEVQPTIEDAKINVNGTDVTTTIENLEPNTTYYVRTFLTNSLGEFYGNEVNFITNNPNCEYVLNTLPITNTIADSATLNGIISLDGNCEFPITEQGFVYATTIQPTIANNKVNVNGTEVTTILENLEPNTTYYVRTFLTNNDGEFYGNEVNFITDNPVYLAENGVTIKAYDWADIEDTGVINGITYTVVDEAMLRDMVANELDVTKVVTTRVTNMEDMFASSDTFNQPIGNWDVSNVTQMDNMFGSTTSFNQDINSWDVSNVLSMEKMFRLASSFNQPIGNWDVSNVTNMNEMFRGTPFNQPIGNWDVSNVSDISYMFFEDEPFNQPIGDWDVSNVTNMSGTFSNSSFNQPIGDWDVSNVTSMYSLFGNCIFNQPIGNWDVSNVTVMSDMFALSSFNQPIGNWNVSNVIVMPQMFYGNIAFNKDLSSWSVDGVINCTDFSFDTPQWTLPQPNFTNCTP